MADNVTPIITTIMSHFLLGEKIIRLDMILLGVTLVGVTLVAFGYS